MLYDNEAPDGSVPDHPPQEGGLSAVEEQPPFDTKDEDVEVDLNNLIDLNMSFKPLQISLQRIMRRVRYLEGDNQVKTEQIKDLQDALRALKKNKDAEDQQLEDLTDIWDELDRLGAMIGELTGEEDRPSIAQLFRARRGVDAKSPKSSAGSERSTTGEKILSKAREELPVEWTAEEREEHGNRHSGDTDDHYGSTIDDDNGRDDDLLHTSRPKGSAGEEDRDDHPLVKSASDEGSSHSRHDANDRKTAEMVEHHDDEEDNEGNGDDESSGKKQSGSEEQGNNDDQSGATTSGGDGLDGSRGDGEGKSNGSPTDGSKSSPTASSQRSPLKEKSPMKSPGKPPRKPESPAADDGRKRQTSARKGQVSAGSRPSISPIKGEEERPFGSGGSRGRRDTAGRLSRRPISSTRKQQGSINDQASEELASFTGSSVFDKLRKDGDDISYLNRVVAEMLAEMKGLQGDVDLLRTLNGEHRTGVEDADGNRRGDGEGDDDDGEGGSGGKGKGGRLGPMTNAEAAEMRDHIRKAGALSADDIAAVKDLSDRNHKLADLERLVRSMEKANELTQQKLEAITDVPEGATEINPVQFGAVAGSVKALERQLNDLHRAGVKDWAPDIEDLIRQMNNVKRDSDEQRERQQRNDRAIKRMEEKGGRVAFAPDPQVVSGSPTVNDAALQLSEDLWRRLEEINDRLENADAEAKRLDDDKADRHAMQRLRDDMQNLKRLMDLNAKRDLSRMNTEGGEGADGGETRALFNDLQQQFLDQMQNAMSDKELAREEMSNLSEFVRQLDHRKADATLVANKAERDYVENALERLMREVEQVLNATNAGLIDTLDKSLNILRDMINGKATKQDIARLQQMIEEEGGSKAAADGLMGFKGYRCLGCNRPVDSIRPRTLPSSMDPFLNRNPQSYPQDSVTRSIQRQQQATALLDEHQRQQQLLE